MKPTLPSSDEIAKELTGVPSRDYPEYRAHILDQYRLYVEMADHISDRRERANSFFLAINTAIVGFIGYSLSPQAPAAASLARLAVSACALVLCYLWYRIIRSYKDLNSAKFRVVHQIEAFLPIRPYDAEWKAVGQGQNEQLYLPFTHVEVLVPWLFLVFYFIVAFLDALQRAHVIAGG